MGVTIHSPISSADMGYFGFYRLRYTVAKCLGDDVADHYQVIMHPPVFENAFAEQTYWDAYDRKLNEMIERYPVKTHKVFAFLYAPDTEGDITYGTCKQILSVIGDYDDDIIYGYAGWGDKAARFRDFKRILQECADMKAKLKWD